MITLPAIFRTETPLAFDSDSKPHSSQWIEFVSLISKLSDAEFPETENQISQLLDQDGDPSHRAALVAGLGHCQIREGKMLIGARTLGKAYAMIPETDADTQAFVTIEMAIFLANIDQYDLALSLLDQVPSLTSNTYLLKLCEYYSLVQRSRLDDTGLLSGLQSSLTFFLDIGEFSTAAYHLKNIGNVHRKSGEFAAAEDAYQRGIDIAKEHGFIHIIQAIEHDRGMLLYRKGDKDQAIALLEEVAGTAESHYIQSFTMANIGFIHFSDKAYTKASESFMKSLNIAADSGVFHMVPGTSYYLGECYQRTGNLELARYFLEKGFQSAHELLKHHFSYSGDRLKAVEGYIQFLKNHQDTVPAQPVDFPFAIDKTLREIRGIFQGALLDFLVNKHGSNRKAIQSLKIADKTWYLVRDRVKPFAIGPPPVEVINFIRNNNQLSWQSINQEFDTGIINYLFHQYGRNKKKLSEKLAVSYTYARQLTGKSQSSLSSMQTNHRNA